MTSVISFETQDASTNFCFLPIITCVSPVVNLPLYGVCAIVPPSIRAHLVYSMTAELIEEASWGNFSDDGRLGEESPVTGVLGAVLIIMFLIGMTGNIYALVVALSGLSGRSTGSLCVYIINLALADLLYLSTIPFVVCTYFARNWFFGDLGCRILLSLDLLTMHASIFLLTTMSLERYWAVARPMRARWAGKSYRKVASVAVWLLSLLLTIPMMVMIQQREGISHKHICFPTWTPDAFRVYLTILFSTSILGPGLVLGIVYSCLAQAYWTSMKVMQPRVVGRVLKQKLFSRIFSIIVAYWACFVPFWAWQLAKLYWSEDLEIGPTAQAYLNFGVTCLTYGNSCINPFLYTLLTRNYHEYMAARGGERQGGRQVLFNRRKYEKSRAECLPGAQMLCCHKEECLNEGGKGK
ncbi:urotensin-2 receptor-like [Heteronotia binoei]|uniref:urotensin-2 receptor-like n=1 Tax=Heteronotia binoei TaxID=13085 RepID=UPI00292E51CC|nr:urotensin-2 receptor-like [Heteronotia binoei]